MNMTLFLIIICLYGAYFTGLMHIKTKSVFYPLNKAKIQAHSIPYTTLFLIIAIGALSVLQFFYPELLFVFERNKDFFLAGEWWRIFTAFFVQDGGVSGSIFNLVSLLLVGLVAEAIWGSRRCLILFIIGGILSEYTGLFWQPIGAGNSVANFSLAASICVFCFTYKPNLPIVITSIFSLGSGIILLLQRDIHGAGFFFGIISLGFLLYDQF